MLKNETTLFLFRIRMIVLTVAVLIQGMFSMKFIFAEEDIVIDDRVFGYILLFVAIVLFIELQISIFDIFFRGRKCNGKKIQNS